MSFLPKRGFTYPDGSVQLTAASNQNLPFSSYTTIYGIFEDPDFDGDVITVGHEGKVALVAANIEVEKVDLRPQNKRYRPTLLKKGFDSASPYFFEAFKLNTPLNTVTIEFWRNDNAGGQELKFKYTLNDASIVSILHLDNKSDDGSLLPLEIVRLAYEELEIEDVEHGKTVVLQNQ
jgi:type VI secretion system Hcp family effector